MGFFEKMVERNPERLRNIFRASLIAVALLGVAGEIESQPVEKPKTLPAIGGESPDRPGVYVMPFEASCRTEEGQEVEGFGRAALMSEEVEGAQGKKCLGIDGQEGTIEISPRFPPRVKIVLPK